MMWRGVITLTAALNEKFLLPEPIKTALSILLPASAGVGVGVLLFAHIPYLASALSSAAAGYGANFSHGYGIVEAFCASVAVSRADIAVIFAALLISYTEAARPLFGAVSFLRALLSALAFSAYIPVHAAALTANLSVHSLPILPAISVLLGAAAAISYLFRVFPAPRARFRSAAAAVVISGALIALRTALFLLGGVLG